MEGIHCFNSEKTCSHFYQNQTDIVGSNHSQRTVKIRFQRRSTEFQSLVSHSLKEIIHSDMVVPTTAIIKRLDRNTLDPGELADWICFSLDQRKGMEEGKTDTRNSTLNKCPPSDAFLKNRFYVQVSFLLLDGLLVQYWHF